MLSEEYQRSSPAKSDKPAVCSVTKKKTPGRVSARKTPSRVKPDEDKIEIVEQLKEIEEV